MIDQYVDTVFQALTGVLAQLAALALPLAIGLGCLFLAVAVVFTFRRDIPALRNGEWRRSLGRGLGYLGVALLAVAGWAALHTPRPLAAQNIAWRESAEATANPMPDAPPVYQSGPSVAVVAEHTFTRTLTLPPYMVQRLGSEGIGVLAPYLTDPSAENVSRLVDTFRRSGQDVVFTREVTREDEAPQPFSNSQVRVNFQRLPNRAYEAEFEARYSFRNTGNQPARMRFQFPLPQAGTVKDLSVTIGGDSVKEPNDGEPYEWLETVAAGETREAVVRYRVTGARTWNYNLGSSRRRVEAFQLDAAPGGEVRFLRGSLQPTNRSNNSLRWELANVVTAQQVSIVFPTEVAGREAFLQALGAFPAGFALFLLAVLVAGFWFHHVPEPGRMAQGLLLFGIGLGAAAVLANYIGGVAAVIIAPLLGAWLAARVLGTRFIVAALPCALLPAAFLSPYHSGLLVLGLVLATAVLGYRVTRSR